MNEHNAQPAVEEVLARIIATVVKNIGIRRLAFSVGQNLVGSWAEGGPLREKASRPLLWLLAKGRGKNGRAREWSISSDLGRLVTLWSGRVGGEHRDNPACHARGRGESAKAFLENTDFGEVAGMLEATEGCTVGTVTAFYEQLWKYPAKVANILMALVSLANTSVRVLRETLRPVERNVSPDLLADMVLSLMKKIRPGDAAELANACMEFIRRLHTGSLLLGRAGKPLFQTYLTAMLQEAAPRIDPQLLLKARIALAEDREAVANAISEALKDNPELVLSGISSLGRLKTSEARAAARKWDLLDGMQTDGLKGALSEGMAHLDTYEIAALVNNICRVLNKVHEARPEIVGSLLGGVVDSLSIDEVRDLASWLVPDVAAAVRPLASEIMPLLLRGLVELLENDGYGPGRDHREALAALRDTLARASGGEQ